ncbi:MAG: extracellular solute-binding protein [Rhodoferax sp.]|nr:extracellular solute-binding protein [Rhodoferax sp.]
MKWRALCIFLWVTALSATSAAAFESVVVASSFPKEVLVVYKKAFERRNPQYRVEFVNFPGTNTVPFLTDRKTGSRPDVFWGSSPDSFRTMRTHGLLQPLVNGDAVEAVSHASTHGIDDEERFYKSQALSGYGVMWNTRYLEARAIPAPTGWGDLTQAVYFGHITMSSPSRSGTTHSIVESILQGFGWRDGWSLILRIAGNCGTITERSFGVPNSVTRGRFGVGLVVDFLALSGKSTGFPVDFIYAWPSISTTASIGLITDGRNPRGGRKFIEFTLSEEGQTLLLQPTISRLPILPAVYAKSTLPDDYHKLFLQATQQTSRYDLGLSESRYLAVGIIFDQLVTFRHRQLVRATEVIHSAQRLLQHRPHAQAQSLVDQAIGLVYQSPISESDGWVVSGATMPAASRLSSMAIQEAELGRKISTNYLAALGFAQQALALLQ